MAVQYRPPFLVSKRPTFDYKVIFQEIFPFIEGNLTRDFLHQVFFTNQFPPGP
jgi:hypothetical protein